MSQSYCIDSIAKTETCPDCAPNIVSLLLRPRRRYDSPLIQLAKQGDLKICPRRGDTALLEPLTGLGEGFNPGSSSIVFDTDLA